MKVSEKDTILYQFIHVSDIHFGKHHICNPETPGASTQGIPRIQQLLIQDLNSGYWSDQGLNRPINSDLYPPLFLIASGDFTQVCSDDEFGAAGKFLNDVATSEVLDRIIGKDKIFMVPGNHDVAFAEPKPSTRFQRYANFYNEFFEGIRDVIPPHKASEFTQVHVLDEFSLVILEINCSFYVEKDTIEQSRGQIDFESIRKIREELKSVDSEKIDNYFKLCVLHHHPILVPALLEFERGIDSVVNSRHLFQILSKFNFHLVLHGHKHFPQVYSYDPEPIWQSNHNNPQLIVSSGSLSSNELPDSSAAMNSYSLITVRWHPNAQRARVRIDSRGLVRKGESGSLAPDEWNWITLKTVEKNISLIDPFPPSTSSKFLHQPNPEDDKLRIAEYVRSRGWKPVLEILPSFTPSQAYEVKVWLVYHGKEEWKKDPVKVVWSAGVKFKPQVCLAENGTEFCAYFAYYDSMLIQAKIIFEDEHEVYEYIYARLP